MSKLPIQHKILIAEDNKALNRIIQKQLLRLGYDVVCTFTGREAMEQVLENEFSLAVLDLYMPECTGFDVLKAIRKYELHIPVIMITLQSEISTQIKSFELGVTLFHPKPINFQLLSTQISSILDNQKLPSNVRTGDLFLELDRGIVRRKDKYIQFSPKEYRLLSAIVNARGKILSRQFLVSNTFRGGRDLEIGSIDTLVCRLRKKLGTTKHGEDIVETVRGEGYRLNPAYADDFNEL